VAFLKNRTSLILVLGLFILAAIGIASSYLNNPAGFLKQIAVILVVGLVVYFVVRRFFYSNPEKREQRAFVKAAKRSKRRLHQNESAHPFQKKTSSTITSMKKSLRPRKIHSDQSPHLTVIEGKKGKKKNRASF
jgi:ABC-type nickel/cobalt efflux system permease component RcnA